MTGDNTDDAEDYSILFIGGRQYRIDETHSQWGACPFGSTDHVGYAHATCEFSIPLDQVPDGDFAFELGYYGTYAAPDLQAASDTGQYDDDNVTNDDTPSFDTSCNGYDYAYLYRDDGTPGEEIVTEACGGDAATLTDPSAAEGEHGYYVGFDDVGDGSGVLFTNGPLNVTFDFTAPELGRAIVSGPNQITLTYTEYVYNEASDYTNLYVNTAPRNVESVDAEGVDIDLSFDGDPVGTEATGSIDINNPPVSVKDAAGNEVAPTSNAVVDDGQAPTVNTLGDGSSDYELPSTCPSVACDRDDTYGAVLVFSEPLSGSSMTSVEEALTAGASSAPRTYVWAPSGDRVRIYATSPVSFPDDVTADIADEPGNTASGVLLVDSAYNPDEVWVDVAWEDQDDVDAYDDTLTWQVDAFGSLINGVDAVAEDGTVHVLPGVQEYFTGVGVFTEGVQVIGPGGDESRFYTDCKTAIELRASGQRVEGLSLYATDGSADDDPACSDGKVITVDSGDSPIDSITLYGNTISGGAAGVVVYSMATDVEVVNNAISDSGTGIDWQGSSDGSISDNSIHGNSTAGLAFTCDGEDCDVSGTAVEYNSIYENAVGISLEVNEDQSEPGLDIGPYNEIYDNTDKGVAIYGQAGNVRINGNKLYGNPAYSDGPIPMSDLHVVDALFVDATENWWGDPDGPLVNEERTEETQNRGTIDMSADMGDLDDMLVFYRPFCTDEDCGELSSADVEPSGLQNLFDTGTFVLPDGQSPDDVTEIELAEDLTITVDLGGGNTSSVVIPEKTHITRTGGGSFDGTALDAEDVDEAGLSGLGSGVVAEGALEWGADVGLTFDPAITLNIYVGTELNGQTLDIKRSPDGGTTWTSDGIVAPATCTVTGGICTFQATKASVFASTSTSSGSSTGGYYKWPAQVVGLLAQHGLKEGDVISAVDGDPDVYIVNEWGYKRLFLNPVIFGFYGHLGGWNVVKRVTVQARNAFAASGLFRNCEAEDLKVYREDVRKLERLLGKDLSVLW